MSAARFVEGVIDVPEVSGAAMIAGDRLLLVSDEEGVLTAERASEQLLGGRVTNAVKEKLQDPAGDEIKADDLEDATATADGQVAYVITSHSRNRHGKPDDRCFLVRLEFDKKGKLERSLPSTALQAAWPPSLSAAQKRSAAQGGLNVEGLELALDGRLWIGLRSPTATFTKKRASKLQEDALALAIANVEELFHDPPKPPRFAAPPTPTTDYLEIAAEAWPVSLTALGIRGLCSEPRDGSLWVLAGVSVDPNHDLNSPPWSIWSWTPPAPARPVFLPARGQLTSPEAFCRLELDGRPYLLLVDDTPQSNYLLVPVELL